MTSEETTESVRAQLVAMMAECDQFSHVQELQNAKLFISFILRVLGRDAGFDLLVKQQLEFSVGRVHPPPRWFHCCANDPHHIIRNRMLSWQIDHPEEGK